MIRDQQQDLQKLDCSALETWDLGFEITGLAVLYYIISQNNCAKLFLSERRRISTNFDNFWQKDGKNAKIMRDALIFHLD